MSPGKYLLPGPLGKVQQTAAHYREFLLDPGTIFTAASGLLLALAAVSQPEGLFHGTGGGGEGSVLYLAAALVGSSYIWWSALQGIRERDFTADIPVTLATMAAIAIGQYPAAAVVAVLLLMGGMLEDFVAARATRSLQSLAKLLPDMVTVRRGGHDESVSLDEVQVGESILVRSGERLAIDGTVISGTDVAMETADVGLLSDDLSKLPHLIEVSRKAIGVIKQNLVFSVGVLAAAVMLTIPGILTPVTGALLHELSSIPVIANSVRLIAYGPKVD